MTQDDIIDAVVKQELAKHSSDRDEIEREYEAKTGEKPHFATSEKSLIAVIDDPTVKRRGRPRKVA